MLLGWVRATISGRGQAKTIAVAKACVKVGMETPLHCGGEQSTPMESRPTRIWFRVSAGTVLTLNL